MIGVTLDQLRIFAAVAEREHLTRAAAALHLTPSAVSSAIRTLEQRYGVVLFHRVGRGIELTDAGRTLLPEAHATLASARAAELALAELGGLLRGTLEVQASQTIAGYWVPPRLVAFRAQHPAIELRLEIGNTESVARAVLEGAADVGFIEGEIDEPALRASVVATDRLIVVVPQGHPWADGHVLRADELIQGSWIMRERGSGTRSAFEDALWAMGADPQALQLVLELPSNESVRAAVQAGGFAAVMSELVAAPELESSRLVRAGLDLPPRAFRMLRHKERYQTKAAAALERMLSG
jgi:DNA-binding transcriptional LysR family regulator